MRKGGERPYAVLTAPANVSYRTGGLPHRVCRCIKGIALTPRANQRLSRFRDEERGGGNGTGGNPRMLTRAFVIQDKRDSNPDHSKVHPRAISESSICGTAL